MGFNPASYFTKNPIMESNVPVRLTDAGPELYSKRREKWIPVDSNWWNINYPRVETRGKGTVITNKILIDGVLSDDGTKLYYSEPGGGPLEFSINVDMLNNFSTYNKVYEGNGYGYIHGHRVSFRYDKCTESWLADIYR